MADPQRLADPEHDRSKGIVLLLAPMMFAQMVSFLVIGLALPVLPLHVHDRLGLSAFVVGLVGGSQFAVSLVTRIWSGQFADSRGAKQAVMVGLVMTGVGGEIYLLSLLFIQPELSVTILLIGRVVVGCAESFIITGAVAWGLVLAGPTNAGRVIAWMGMAMFAALALGAPAGTSLFNLGGMCAVSVATVLVPIAALPLVSRLRAAPAVGGTRQSFVSVTGAVWKPGLGSAFSSVGFGAILTFGSLLFADRGWSPIWLPFAAFAFALVVARALLGHVPDRIGGAKIALGFVLIQASGLAIIWLSSGRMLATTGAALTGFGYSLVYPGFGVEAVRSVPAEGRGLAMGAYTAFLDVALGFGTPALGLVANHAGINAVFVASMVAVLCAGVIAGRLMIVPPQTEETQQ